MSDMKQEIEQKHIHQVLFSMQRDLLEEGLFYLIHVFLIFFFNSFIHVCFCYSVFSFNEVEDEISKSYYSFQIVNKQNKPFLRASISQNEELDFAPENISAMILTKVSFLREKK